MDGTRTSPGQRGVGAGSEPGHEAAAAQGLLDQADCTIECPRHGSRFDLKTGKPLTLPAYEPVETFPVTVQDGVIKIEVD